jgi:pimeloyl-ACP methyl ester carboxylesterase
MKSQLILGAALSFQDIVRPEHTLEIFNHFPHAQLYLLPATGHSTFYQRPDWLNPIILSFLTETRR